MQDVTTNPSADYPVIALCKNEDELSFWNTPIIKAKYNITSDDDVQSCIQNDYNIKSLTIDGELKFKKDTWVKYEYQLTQDDFQSSNSNVSPIYIKLNSGCRNVYLKSKEKATQFLLIYPNYDNINNIAKNFLNIEENIKSLLITQIDEHTYDLTNFYLYFDKTIINEDKNVVGIFLADSEGNALTQNLEFECFDVTTENDSSTDYTPILSVGEHDIEVELLQQLYTPFFNTNALVDLDMSHVNGKYIHINNICNEANQLKQVRLPNNLNSIGYSTFYGCSGLTSVVIPSSVTSIGNYAFENCSSLTLVTISNSVTSIGEYAFYSCGGLTSVTIPNSVTSIGYAAFYLCSSLTSVTCYATTAPILYSDIFNGLPKNGTLYVPNGSDYSSWLRNLPSGWTIAYI